MGGVCDGGGAGEVLSVEVSMVWVFRSACVLVPDSLACVSASSAVTAVVLFI